MRRRTDVNWYTGLLFGLGFYGLYESFSGLAWSEWPTFVIVLGLSIGLSFFPIRLPQGLRGSHHYSSANVGLIFLLMNVSVSTCMLALLLETLMMYANEVRWQVRHIRWFRVVCTMGMYLACVGAVHGFLVTAQELPMWLKSFVALGAFDIINLTILLGVQRSLGETITYRMYFAIWRDIAFPVLISSVVLSQILKPAGPLHLLQEAIYSALILVSVIYLTRRHEQATKLYETMATKYRAIAENTDDLILSVDDGMTVTFASPSHASGLGRPVATVEGRPIADLILPEDLQMLNLALQRARYTRRPFTMQLRFLTSAGLSILTETKTAFVVGTGNESHGVVMVARDLSERIAAEEMLKKSDRLAMVGQLAAGVAHEVRNPLTSIKGFLKIISRSPEDIYRFESVLWSELEQIETVINEFLVWSKPQYGHREDRDIVAIMKNVIAVMETQAILRNIDIHLHITGEIPAVSCNDGHLKQVFVNILKNAIEAMPDGGPVNITIDSSEGSVSIVVRDDGCGIPPALLKRIGDPFFTTKKEGTGLGMMVTHKIIADHGGSIQLISDGIKGTTVHIQLPSVMQTPPMPANVSV